jgi:hypothetical protein
MKQFNPQTGMSVLLLIGLTSETPISVLAHLNGGMEIYTTAFTMGIKIPDNLSILYFCDLQVHMIYSLQ